VLWVRTKLSKDLSELLEKDNHTPSGQTNSSPSPIPHFPQLQPRILPPKATRSHHNVRLGSHSQDKKYQVERKARAAMASAQQQIATYVSLHSDTYKAHPSP